MNAISPAFYQRYLEDHMKKYSELTKKELEHEKLALIKQLVEVEEERDYVLGQKGDQIPETTIKHFEDKIRNLELLLADIIKILEEER